VFNCFFLKITKSIFEKFHPRNATVKAAKLAGGIFEIGICSLDFDKINLRCKEKIGHIQRQSSFFFVHP